MASPLVQAQSSGSRLALQAICCQPGSVLLARGPGNRVSDNRSASTADGGVHDSALASVRVQAPDSAAEFLARSDKYFRRPALHVQLRSVTGADDVRAQVTAAMCGCGLESAKDAGRPDRVDLRQQRQSWLRDHREHRVGME